MGMEVKTERRELLRQASVNNNQGVPRLLKKRQHYEVVELNF
jgi:hypothetical protein